MNKELGQTRGHNNGKLYEQQRNLELEWQRREIKKGHLNSACVHKTKIHMQIFTGESRARGHVRARSKTEAKQDLRDHPQHPSQGC